MMPSTAWQKSSFSGGGEGNACVELASHAHTLLLRESEDPAHILTPAPTALAALLHHLRENAN
ncbi:DUF397 domain-containing protein [Streptomyces sp. NPDC058657]|uniref:DUF397 domain-containing protein n=1 Tax=unclassified Streptomyces TaxID=2593676 RepID=UPI0036477D7D